MVLATNTPKLNHYDVIIVGGAMYGSSVAWWLSRNSDFDGSILVVDRDMSFEFASTSHTNSCIRQQFSNPTNIQISQFGAEFINNFQSFFDNDPRVPEIHIQSFGYMYLASNLEFAASLKESQVIQAKFGAATASRSHTPPRHGLSGSASCSTLSWDSRTCYVSSSPPARQQLKRDRLRLGCWPASQGSLRRSVRLQ